MLKKLARDPGLQIGFSDAGAHLRNMAFYNCGLRLLRHVRDAERAGTPFMTIEQAVHRLTGELADWYHLDAGHLRLGDRADLVVVDPQHLDESLDTYAEAEIKHFGGLSRMVNRNDQTVNAVFVAGQAVVLNGQPTEIFGPPAHWTIPASGRCHRPRRSTTHYYRRGRSLSARHDLRHRTQLRRMWGSAIRNFAAGLSIAVFGQTPPMPAGPS